MIGLNMLLGDCSGLLNLPDHLASTSISNNKINQTNPHIHDLKSSR